MTDKNLSGKVGGKMNTFKDLSAKIHLWRVMDKDENVTAAFKCFYQQNQQIIVAHN